MILGFWTGFQSFGLFAARLLARFALDFAAGNFVGIVLLSLLIALFNPFGNLGLGFGQRFEALLATSDFGGQVVLVARFLLIDLGRLGQ